MLNVEMHHHSVWKGSMTTFYDPSIPDGQNPFFLSEISHITVVKWIVNVISGSQWRIKDVCNQNKVGAKHESSGV